MQPKSTSSSKVKGEAKTSSQSLTSKDEKNAAKMQEAIDELINEPKATLANHDPEPSPTEMEQAARTRRKPEIGPSTMEFTNVFNWLSARLEEEEEGAEAVEQYKHHRSHQPVGEPLRLLNSYGFGYSGYDRLRGRCLFSLRGKQVTNRRVVEDPAYRGCHADNDLCAVHHKHEVPLGISLRGGGLDDGLDDDTSESVDDEFIQSQLQLEGVEDIVNQFAADDELGDLDIDMYQLFEVMAPIGVSLRGGTNPGRPSTSLSSPTDSDPPRPQTARGDIEKRPSVSADDMDPPSPSRMISWARTPLKPVTEESNPVEPSATTPVPPDINDIPPPQQCVPATQQKMPGHDQSMREEAYANPMSVRAENKIPADTPALEKVLRFESDSIPTMSLGVMTPTEQRRLQIAYHNLRNIALERSVQCPYDGCESVFAMAEENRLQKHLKDVHWGDQCNFCDSVLWKCWSENERRAHFLKEHRNLFLTEPQWKADNSFNVPSLFRVDWERESRYSFCPRCGRDHKALNAHADRTHHDNICYPGSEEGRCDWTACEACGGKKVPDSEHECQTVINPDEPPYCHKCAVPAGLFSDLYRATHHLHCHGHNNEVANFCPWCGQSCGRDMVEDALKHMTNCAERPDNQAQGPLIPETATPWPFLLEYNPKREGPGIHKDPPAYCTECKQAVFHMDANLLMKHIEDNHEDRLDYCIFCKLDYKPRGWLNSRRAKVQHLDDHIHERKQTLATDLVQSRLWPAGHPYTKRRVEAKDLEKLQVLRELQHKDEQLANLRERNYALVTEMNEDKASIEMLRNQLRLQLREAGRQSKHDLHQHTPTLDTPPAPSAVKPRAKKKEKQVDTGTPTAKDKKGKGKEKEAQVLESASR